MKTQKGAKRPTRKVAKKTVKKASPKKKATVRKKKVVVDVTPQDTQQDTQQVKPETGLTPVHPLVDMGDKAEVRVPEEKVEIKQPKKEQHYKKGDWTIFERVRIRAGEHAGKTAFIRSFVSENQVALDFTGTVPLGAGWMNYDVSNLEKIN